MLITFPRYQQSEDLSVPSPRMSEMIKSRRSSIVNRRLLMHACQPSGAHTLSIRDSHNREATTISNRRFLIFGHISLTGPLQKVNTPTRHHISSPDPGGCCWRIVTPNRSQFKIRSMTIPDGGASGLPGVWSGEQLVTCPLCSSLRPLPSNCPNLSLLRLACCERETSHNLPLLFSLPWVFELLSRVLRYPDLLVTFSLHHAALPSKVFGTDPFPSSNTIASNEDHEVKRQAEKLLSCAWSDGSILLRMLDWERIITSCFLRRSTSSISLPFVDSSGIASQSILIGPDSGSSCPDLETSQPNTVLHKEVHSLDSMRASSK